MKGKEPYNPLDKLNLARSIEVELLSRPVDRLGAVDHVSGAGVYAIYYVGPFPSYGPLAKANVGGVFQMPIYVGKAIPRGGRKGGISADSSSSKALSERLKQHASSVREAHNLNIEDFLVRHLVVDDIWIPLGENILIETFKPVWNRAIDGFGNKDPGQRRATQYKSPWDILHPGRKFAEKLAGGLLSPDVLAARVDDYFAGRPLSKMPKALVEHLEDADEN